MPLSASLSLAAAWLFVPCGIWKAVCSVLFCFVLFCFVLFCFVFAFYVLGCLCVLQRAFSIVLL
jgi:hypothetical protein